MFGFLRKKAEVQKEENELLKPENIILGCKRMPKEEVIRQMGKILYESGYVDKEYTEAMIKREKSFPTNIGNGIALPHGVEEAKKDIRHSGIAVMVFPEGTDWGEEEVKLVIGVAGTGEEHLKILSTIAEILSEPAAVERLVKNSREEIYRAFTGGDAA